MIKVKSKTLLIHARHRFKAAKRLGAAVQLKIKQKNQQLNDIKISLKNDKIRY